MDRTSLGAAVAARGLGVAGPRGWTFRAVDVAAAPGDLVAVEGPSGSGRTCLLLTLTGRMRPTAGTAEVGGLPLPRRMAAVRRITALAQIAGVCEPEGALSVGEHLRERVLLCRRFTGGPRALFRPPAEAAERAEAALATVGLDPDALPAGPRTLARDLGRPESLRLSLALALIGGPRLIAVDDADLKLGPADRADAWALLRSVAASGPTVLAVCGEAPEDADAVVTTHGKETADAFAAAGRA
ncbi:ATP-binding cassette domain-containing protein [Streptomyces mobaraensis NBRC 13819 = DSM 40847]|uniref:ABC-type multidrug transport system, ATPase component n=1 Tax=Streptomyces mobaraensis (strain ATCC 29032 / DSM 40847 / JCM 4168 / NBRC 13819 / NCIMB 11159 / IPCR 16-22) TaxID=1223523 RepID=M3C5W0_STRM1|nr:ABC transporter ATP-binding protein [Streptomyces mobaraensis]EME99321.1 ABC-type multidrug transport system, ATPase component [Streptomyces mobaraensis NBRC 13819 = DSM 40847]QTT73406.1 ATP-binding cassette domain-containing protein [Streptomyces mobaraensis NBRC 13819 = DSM 40847]